MDVCLCMYWLTAYGRWSNARALLALALAKDAEMPARDVAVWWGLSDPDKLRWAWVSPHSPLLCPQSMWWRLNFHPCLPTERLPADHCNSVRGRNHPHTAAWCEETSHTAPSTRGAPRASLHPDLAAALHTTPSLLCARISGREGTNVQMYLIQDPSPCNPNQNQAKTSTRLEYKPHNLDESPAVRCAAGANFI